MIIENTFQIFIQEYGKTCMNPLAFLKHGSSVRLKHMEVTMGFKLKFS